MTRIDKKIRKFVDDFNELLSDQKSNIKDTIRGYKVFRGVLTQNGTDDPVTAITLENTLGFTPVWGRTNIGQYNMSNFPAETDVNKWQGISHGHGVGLCTITVYQAPMNAECILWCYNFATGSMVAADSLFPGLDNNWFVEIRQYI